jgi:Ca2+-binding RTX toxin-like protein
MAIINGNGGNNALNGTTLDDEIYGMGGDDLIFAFAGNDTIDGGTGDDVMFGAEGNDIYIVSDSGDVILDTKGIDTVRSSVSYIIQKDIEILQLTGGANINGIGSLINNQLTGNTGNNVLSGLGGNDTLTGLDGNDTLDGGIGKDTLVGGIGNDVYIIADTGDVLVEAVGEGTDTVQVSSGSYVMAANIENLQVILKGLGGTGNVLNNIMIGSSGNNNLSGLGGDDTLDGAGGADRLTGGIGNDLYIVDDSRDNVTEKAGEGTDTVRASANFKLGNEIEILQLTGIGNINGTGNALNNTITGNVGNNTLDGGLGIDTLAGGDGNDTYVIDTLTDVLTENPGEGTDTIRSLLTFTLAANFENLVLTGTAAINGTGNSVANTLTGNNAANVLAGGDGNDSYVVGTGDTVVELAGEGTSDKVFSSITWTLGAELENLELTGTSAIHAFGNGLDNTLTGNKGKNTLDGGLGNDTYVADPTDIIIDAGGNDTLETSFSMALISTLENMRLSGLGNINATGNAGDNTITGNNGNNTLDGGAGADSLVGLGGNDTYIVDTLADTLIEAAGGGNDTVMTGLTYTLGAELENLTLTGVAAVNGTGNTLGNILTGNVAANILDGGDGDDTYVIDALDTVVVDSSGNDTIVQGFASYDITARLDIENLTLTGTGVFNLTGNTGNNTLIGNSAINTLNGGLGDDTYIIGKGDVVIDSGGSDSVLVDANFTVLTDIENIVLLGTGNWKAIGDGAVNTLTGNVGANTLDGMGGADTMAGGRGNDTYVVDNIGDVYIESPGEGTDTIQSYISMLLDAEFENLKLLGTAAIDGTGNGGDNTLIGNAGDNTLDGGLGADFMSGGAGNDVFIVDDPEDRATDSGGYDIVLATATTTLGAGIENLNLQAGFSIDGTGNGTANILIGNSFSNHLSGMGGNDIIVGGDGDDSLDGGDGADIMTGGDGSDTYVVNTAGDQVLENAGEGVQDGVYSYISYTIPINIEGLQLVGEEEINATGSNNGELLAGNGERNTLDGLGGNDYLSGQGGDDLLKGGLGDDYLTGGTGVDTLDGGNGADTYAVERVSLAYGPDIGRGFSLAQGDKIDVSDVIQSFGVLEDYISIQELNGDTIIAVDYFGTRNYTEALLLDGFTGLAIFTLDELQTAGILVT